MNAENTANLQYLLYFIAINTKTSQFKTVNSWEHFSKYMKLSSFAKLNTSWH